MDFVPVNRLQRKFLWSTFLPRTWRSTMCRSAGPWPLAPCSLVSIYISKLYCLLYILLLAVSFWHSVSVEEESSCPTFHLLLAMFLPLLARVFFTWSHHTCSSQKTGLRNVSFWLWLKHCWISILLIRQIVTKPSHCNHLQRSNDVQLIDCRVPCIPLCEPCVQPLTKQRRLCQMKLS